MVMGYFATGKHRDASPIGIDAFGPGGPGAFRRRSSVVPDRLVALVARAIAAGLIRPDLDPEFVADSLVEQHVHLALEVADAALVLVHGAVTMQGAADELRSDPALLEVAYLSDGAAHDPPGPAKTRI
jgi:hypothetical protein